MLSIIFKMNLSVYQFGLDRKKNHVHYIHSTYTLHTHYINTTYTLHTHYIHTPYTLHTHTIHTTYTLHTHYMHTTYTSYSTAQRRCPLTRRSELARALADCEYIECTIAIIIIVILVRSLLLVDIMCSVG